LLFERYLRWIRKKKSLRREGERFRHLRSQRLSAGQLAGVKCITLKGGDSMVCPWAGSGDDGPEPEKTKKK
jgi:hypothetical protein